MRWLDPECIGFDQGLNFSTAVAVIEFCSATEA